MGYKCPACHADFGTNKADLIAHIKSNKDCLKKTGLINTMLSEAFKNIEKTL